MVTRQLKSYILLQSIWGVPPACGPLLQLASAQIGQGNSPTWLQQNIGLKLKGHPVNQQSILGTNHKVTLALQVATDTKSECDFPVVVWVPAYTEFIVVMVA